MKPNAETAVLRWLLTVRHTAESMWKQTTSRMPDPFAFFAKGWVWKHFRAPGH
jgi:hypothetical protein